MGIWPYHYCDMLLPWVHLTNPLVLLHLLRVQMGDNIWHAEPWLLAGTAYQVGGEGKDGASIASSVGASGNPLREYSRRWEVGIPQNQDRKGAGWWLYCHQKKKKKTKDYNGRKKIWWWVQYIFSVLFFKKSQLVFLTLFSISIALPFVFFLKHIVFRLAIALILSTFYTETIQ